MTHRNSYVLAIKDQSKQVLREIDGKVYIPFNTEYSLLVKNNNSTDAVCTVTIDGTDVLGGHELQIPAGRSVDLERFLVDGNLHTGKRFKFVSLSDSQVQDPSSGKNGIVEVTFWATLQSDFLRGVVLDSGNCINHAMYCTSVGSQADSVSFTASQVGASNLGATVSQVGVSNLGATVAGATSNQAFAHGKDLQKIGNSIVLTLQILGKQEPLLVHTPLFCTKCLKAVKFTENYCSRCGTQIKIFG